MAYIWENNVATTLASALAAGATSVTINTATAPANNPPIPGSGNVGVLTLQDSLDAPTQREIISYTGRTDNGDGTFTLTGLTRGLESTTGVEFSSGAVVFMGATASRFKELFAAVPDHEAAADPHSQYVQESTKGQAGGVASLDSSGAVPIEQIPPAAIERLVIVADQTARYALTTAEVQKGDTVKETDTGLMYYIVDDANLDNSSGYAEYTAGAASSVPWSGVTGKPTLIEDADATDLTDGGDSPLHHHDSDRDRANHTGTQPLSSISDAGTAAAADIGTADTEVPTNSDLRTAYDVEPRISVKPTLSLNFADNEYEVYEDATNSFTKKPLADILTISNGGGAVTTPTGKIATVASNIGRLTTTDGKQGILSEEARTNLLLMSDSFDTEYTVALSGITGTFVVGETVTGGTSAATATVTYVGSDFIGVKDRSGAFTGGETITGGTSGATGTVGTQVAVWEKYDATVTANTVTAPYGTTTADTITASATEGSIQQRNVSISGNAAHTWSLYVKKNDVDLVRFSAVFVGGTTSYLAQCTYDFATDTVSAVSDDYGTASVSRKLLNNGWVRITYSVTDQANSTQVRMYISPKTAGGSMYVWRAGLEEGAFPASPIKTENAQVTRPGDDVSRAVGAEFNPNEFTLLTSFHGIPETSASSSHVMAISTNTTSSGAPRLSTRIDGGTGVAIQLVTDAGSVWLNANILPHLNASGVNKVAVAVNATLGSASIAVNGALVSESTGNSGTFNNMARYWVSSSFANGNVIGSGFNSYPAALSDAELIALTKVTS